MNTELDAQQSQRTEFAQPIGLPGSLVMKEWIGAPPAANPFVERRAEINGVSGVERRQFTNSHDGLSPEAREFALAIDGYKLLNRRRFITYEEILNVFKTLGYCKANA